MAAVHDEIGSKLEGWVNSLPSDETVENAGDIGIIGDWIAVVSMVRVNAEGIPVTEYYLCMKDGTLLPHIALGLIRIGNHLVVNQTGEHEQ
jgi:hypothetical protein